MSGCLMRDVSGAERRARCALWRDQWTSLLQWRTRLSQVSWWQKRLQMRSM